MIETALATNWIAVPLGDPKAKHDSSLPRQLACRLREVEAELEEAKLTQLATQRWAEAEKREKIEAEQQVKELQDAIPIVTDGRFDAESAIFHLRHVAGSVEEQKPSFDRFTKGEQFPEGQKP